MKAGIDIATETILVGQGELCFPMGYIDSSKCEDHIGKSIRAFKKGDTMHYDPQKDTKDIVAIIWLAEFADTCEEGIIKPDGSSIKFMGRSGVQTGYDSPTKESFEAWSEE